MFNKNIFYNNIEFKFAQFYEYFKIKNPSWNFEKSITLCVENVKTVQLYILSWTVYNSSFLALNGKISQNKKKEKRIGLAFFRC